MGKYVEIKDKFFIRSKLDKKRVIKTENNIINISSITGEGVKILLKKIKQKLIKNQKNEPIFSR